MRNVIKGYQSSHMAVPKVHMANINKEFASFHSPKVRMGLRKPPASPMPKMPRAPGHSPRSK